MVQQKQKENLQFDNCRDDDNRPIKDSIIKAVFGVIDNCQKTFLRLKSS